ncbi:MAG: type II toxin-antitoxin system Phd/YefM family antitoxin [Deltaproteobacteria bacterium]|nr:type II toxin-antitoxin system Phd/YefM family antitoxin [Deltaproteobacteria bacterium]
MIRINIHEAKTHLSRYLGRLEKEGRIVICKRNVAIAEIRPTENRDPKPRRIGLAKGRFDVPSSFFDPLPDDLLAAFGGDAR